MMCGPVLRQWLLAVGFVAYGSVLLASVSPASMYMKPALPVAGGWWPIQECNQAMALASMHIGSGPGVAGLSGMQVKPFVPLRSVRREPLASMATNVAPFATLAGAAFIALAMSSASLSGAAAFFAGGDAPLTPTAERSSKPVRAYLSRVKVPPLLKSQPDSP